jgi:SAM-dependent methyltransferase
MAEHMNLYERAMYYDVIFDRDVSREVSFLMDVFKRATGRPAPLSVLDIACGPGYHGRAFARQGFRTVGLDLNEAMIDLAREKDKVEGLACTWLVEDMRRFNLEEPVDLAFVMFDGLDALVSQDDLIEHLKAVARALTPGGVYVIDLTHPRDCAFQTYADFHYAGQRDGVQVDIQWAINQPQFDLVTGIADTEVELRVVDHGKEMIVRDKARERLLLPQEIEALCKLTSALKVEAWYGGYDVRQALTWAPECRRMIAVLRKTDG